MNIYIASSEKYVEKIQEDIYLRDFYKKKGFICEILTLKKIVELSEPSDRVILKSIWGYHLNYEEFIKQILILKERKVKLINDYNFILWNVNKINYMSELKDINFIPTTNINFKDIKNKTDIDKRILRTSKIFNTDKFVIKPNVSASGYLTLKYDQSQNNNEVISLINDNKHLDFIIQPYRPSISLGELSVILIDGKPMYGVNRFPGIFTEGKDVEYINVEQIPGGIKNQINEINNFFINKFESLPKISRVDFVNNDFKYEIMEIELIDPDLFFRFIPNEVLQECLKKMSTI